MVLEAVTVKFKFPCCFMWWQKTVRSWGIKWRARESKRVPVHSV